MARSAPCRPAWLAGLAATWLTGCGGAQSALDPAGHEAELIARLFWWMTGGAAVIWLAVVALAIGAARHRAGSHTARRAGLLIVIGGAALPTVVLAALLVDGLTSLRTLVEPAPPGSLRVAVSGEQWWWRVTYQPPGAEPIALANEVRLPVGEPVDFRLESVDVIHSFWIPPLGGKMDMIPGRVTRLTLRPMRPGVFRGVCAEYCGTSHALMAFEVVVEDRPAFDRWLAGQREPARPPRGALAARGQDLFLAHGCAACHAIRGTPARGVVGPDLTHVGGRLSVGGGILPGRADAIERWIAHTGQLKPGVLMPTFDMLPSGDLAALAAYLDGLE